MKNERELLEKLFKVTTKLDYSYCTILNREDLSLAMSGKEYEEINDVLIEVEDYLGYEN